MIGIRLFLLLTLNSVLFAEYVNCEFQNKYYEEVCEKLVEKNVSYEYVNRFLLSYKKTSKLDEKSWKYLHPNKIVQLRKNEKKANNTLLPHVPKIRRHLKKYKKVYDYTEKKFGVNREIVASILMKETALGKIKLKHDAFEVFNTILIKNKTNTPRDKWLINMAKSNMVSIIQHCYDAKISPKRCNLPRSYAGAIGIPQFMPSSFVYTQGYKTKVADLNKMQDAIVSASKFLNEKAGFRELIDWNKLTNIESIESAWYEYEVKNDDSSLVYEMRKNKAYNCFLCKDKKYEYLRGYAKKIMRYNNSSNYAIGVIRLGYESCK